jgi:hypothetical protein
MDPETGLYPKMFGRTEDRNKKIELEKLANLKLMRRMVLRITKTMKQKRLNKNQL